MKTYFRLLAFSKPYSRFVPKYFFLVIFAIVFGVINFTLIIPLLNVLFNTYKPQATVVAPHFTFSTTYLKNSFYYYLNIMIGRYGKEGALEYVCAVIVLFVFLTNFFRYFSQRVLVSMRTHVVKQVREKLFERLSILHLGFYNQHQKGNLMSMVSNDMMEIEVSVVSSIQAIFREPLMIIAYFVTLFVISAKLTLFTIFFLPVAGLIITSISKRLRKQADIGQKLLGNILSITDEVITGIRIVKAFNAQKYVQEKFEEENEHYRRISRSMMNKRELASPISEFLGVFVVAVVLIYGGKMVLEKSTSLTAAQFITYIVVYSQILSPAKNISTAITNIQRGLAAGDRVLNIIDAVPEVTEQAGAQAIKNFEKEISYSNLSFAYEKTPVLKNINLSVPKGKIIALVGQSGSGKSTLADLLPRFYDPAEGGILIDGIDIRKYKINDLRKLMGIVTQESILFNDTVFNNIAFGMDNAKEADVIAAAKIANAHDFIMEMEQGYQSNIGDRGGKLSGGQRQRLSIARAVLKNPPILILDEATSALDTESEKLVQDALNKLMENRTSIVIAHRLSTIQHADEIVVLYQGEIIEKGTHDVLLQQGGTYKKLYDLQTFT